MEEKEIKRKKLYSIVIMLIIIILTLILMLTSFSITINYNGKYQGSKTNPDDKPEEPENQYANPDDYYVSIVKNNDVDLYVDTEVYANEDFKGDNVKTIDNERIVEITGTPSTTEISLQSFKGVTSCNYSIVFTPTKNDFENTYFNEYNEKQRLNNQLILRISSYNYDTPEKIDTTHIIDVAKIETTDYRIDYLVISDDANTKGLERTVWKSELIFNNYEKYNQMTNVEKEVEGEINIVITECFNK